MLELSHISKTYQTSKGIKTHALKDINLKFSKKGMVFILGKSGSGKSTLLNVIGGLDQADEGEVIIHQKSSKEFTQADYDAYRNTYIGFIFQEFYLMEEYTIEKNIALSLQLQQKEATPEAIEAILDKVGLSGYGGRYPNELSGGQKQRVAIARSLIKSPQILMADEPTGALDSSTGKEIFTTLKELSQEKLVIVVSHDEEAAHTYADRIITFADGNVISDTNPEVEKDASTFEQIRSHLPFKDSFYLGITCLKHKKIRMVFTVLLTSFALLTLALSDSVGNFNDVDAQYKAMNDSGIQLVGIQHQYLTSDGSILMNYGRAKRHITDAQAKEIKKSNAIAFASVYESLNQSLTLGSFGIDQMDLSVYENASQRFLLTEMNDFKDLNYQDVLGAFPKNHKEVAISSYLADIIISTGIQDSNGKMLYPASYEEIISSIQLPIEASWYTISGIAKVDLSEFEPLKEVSQNEMDEEDYKLARKLSKIVNISCDKLYVKEGFVQSLQLPRSNTLSTPMGSFLLERKNNTTYTSQLSYPTESFMYYNGSELTSATALNKNEVVMDVGTLSNYLGVSGKQIDFNDMFANLTQEEKEAELKKLANQVIGKTMNLSYLEFYEASSKVFEQGVIVKGIIMPKEFTEEALYQSNLLVSKELIEPYILEPYYLGELLTNIQGTEAKALLSTYNMDQEFAGYTIASDDVRNVRDFAKFATQVFFWASIAFFGFAAMLMMNFIMVSIGYRKKEIGILRSIGARSLDVVKIFVWEALILALLSYGVTLIFLYSLSALVNSFAMDTVGILISPVIITMRQPFILAGTVLIIAFLASCLPIIRIARQRPIDAIKK